MTDPALVAVAHGTRDPVGVATVEALLNLVRSLRPGSRVEVGYLDLVRPSLDETLAALRGEAVLVPLLLGAGHHVRTDIPAALATAPRLRASVARALGPDPLLATALSARLAEAGWAGSPVVLAAAGSTDPAANADTARMATMLQARLNAPVLPSYLCASSPTPAEAVARLHAGGHTSVAVAGYLLAPGTFSRRASRSGAALTSAPLGTHAAVAELILQRYDETAAQAARPGSLLSAEAP
ncbi:sirohydrochlorin chelatase [Streptomyces lushanensis]|uniref:sirohydrochlorin chelatase n=1 Tax=Streptomyces lushanensis TaxID=1434255 RepID=UPI000831CCA4|nr:sirohydrochlorin chelatase [Streptomyces lushanensis]